jgi:dipeptidyl aminopeptidase/acylaminoacyl peptidase
MTIDDLMRVRFLSDVRISPDGKQIAYVVSIPSLEKDAHEAELYVVPASGGTPLQLTHATHIFNQPIPAPELKWSPDGALISFIALVGDTPQVFAISSRGGEAFPLVATKDTTRSSTKSCTTCAVTRYEWSPDGKRIAFTAPDPESDDESRRKKDKSYFTKVDRNNRLPRIWVQDVPGGTANAITPPHLTVIDFGWAPDGKTIVYSASNVVGFHAPYHSSLYSVPANGGESNLILSRPGTNRGPRVSPDGQSIAFISSGGELSEIGAKDLYVMATDGRVDSIRRLTNEDWLQDFVWAPDSRSVFYVTGEQTNGAGMHMFEQPIMRVSVTGGSPEIVTTGPVVAFSPSVSRNGDKLAYKACGSRDACGVNVMTLPDHHVERLVDINPELQKFELGDLKAVSWKSFDGAETWGLLLTPPGYKAGARIPLVVYCHGGPIGGFTYGLFPQFMHLPGQVDPYPVEAMASAGMAILFPMPRGGSGYGVAGFRKIIKSWGEVDYKDIMAGVDSMIARGIADPDRLGVMGASYGGFMTNWIVTQTNRFKAASSGCSLSDLPQMYYTSPIGDFMVEYYGLPWEANESMVRHSPITFVKNVTTPLLLQHGELDDRVPLSQAREFYKALKALNKDVELEIYPRGGHVNFEPPLEREYWRSNLQWFTRWLNLSPTTY